MSFAVAPVAAHQVLGIANVRDWGAVGDGATDDTAALQQALNSGYAEVFLPASTGYLAAQLTIPSTVRRLYGPGGGGATLVQKTAGQDQLYSTTMHDIVIERLGFQGIPASDNIHVNNSAIHVNGAIGNPQNSPIAEIWIDGCEFFDQQEFAVYLAYARNIQITRNRLYNTSQGIDCQNIYDAHIAFNSILGTQLTSTFNVAIIAATSDLNPPDANRNSLVVVEGNIITNRNQCEGVLVHDCDGVIVKGNIFSGIQLGCSIQMVPGDGFYIAHASFVDNVYMGEQSGTPEAHNNGMLVVGGDPTGAQMLDCLVANNICEHSNWVNQNPNHAGILCTGNIRNLALRGNTIRDFLGTGIWVDGGTSYQLINFDFTDNTIREGTMLGSTQVGIYFAAGTGVVQHTGKIQGGQIGECSVGIQCDSPTDISGVDTSGVRMGPNVATPIHGLGVLGSASYRTDNGLGTTDGILAANAAGALAWVKGTSGEIVVTPSPQNSSAIAATCYGSGNVMNLHDAGSQGANIVLQGNGANPAKTLGAQNGSFVINNNANSSTLLALDDTGNMIIAGNITTYGELRFTAASQASATGGSAGALPAQPQGYMLINILGTNYKLPFYNV